MLEVTLTDLATYTFVCFFHFNFVVSYNLVLESIANAKLQASLGYVGQD